MGLASRPTAGMCSLAGRQGGLVMRVPLALHVSYDHVGKKVLLNAGCRPVWFFPLTCTHLFGPLDLKVTPFLSMGFLLRTAFLAVMIGVHD